MSLAGAAGRGGRSRIPRQNTVSEPIAKATRTFYRFSMATSSIHPVWQKHPGLVWSNRNADDTIRIRAALVRPHFGVLLDVAVAFGLERLKTEWTILNEEPTPQVLRAAPIVERILSNIEIGFRDAAS